MKNSTKKISRLFGVFCIGLALMPVALSADPNFPVESTDEEGFVSIFDGKTLNGWKGDPTYWSVKDGVLTGIVTPETLLEQNSFIIWQGGTPRNFELKMQYRVSDKGNSGINYRSVPYSPKGQKYALKGYQLDIDGEGMWTGQNYEEKGREWLALRGQMTQIRTGKVPQIISQLGDKDEMWNAINKDGWNEAHIIARDNVIIHLINGKVMSIVIDDDPANRTMEGLIGVQVHVGPPMKIEYKNIRLKELK
ncbi:MAG: DUF1080 domain-containing protein [Bacteroidales bacterium]|nr:DUF1080 domain-containing protein [Bacteroidales bacterium]